MTTAPPYLIILYAESIADITPARSIAKSTPPLVVSITSSTKFSFCGFIQWVAPNSFAFENFVSSISIPIIVSAPPSFAPIIPFKPTPPNPNIATESPLLILAVFITAPTPVITAQPNNAASSKEIDFSITTTDPLSTTAYSDIQEIPVWWFNLSPFKDFNLLPPDINSPFPFVAAANSQTCGLPSRHLLHLPQLGENWNTTWSPTLISLIAFPVSTTSPDPSWPMTRGSGIILEPFITDKSEWQSPAPFTLTRTSLSLGLSIEISSIDKGLLFAYGFSQSFFLITAALHLIVIITSLFN